MEMLLLKLVALLRPLGSVEVARPVFDVLGIGLFALLCLVFLSTSAVRRSINVSSVDLAIFAFSAWCVSIYLIYFDKSDPRDLLKIIIPLLGYTIVKQVVGDRRQYETLLFWMLVGFIVPTVWSAVLIATGSEKAIHYVSYWTGVARYDGAYEGAHALGHSMALLLIIMVVYNKLRRTDSESQTGRVATIFQIVPFGVLAILAVYCLYMSQVRSAVTGLLVFGVMYLYFYNRRLLMFGGAAFATIAVLTTPFWIPALLPELAMRDKGIEVKTSELGSGRPEFWMNDLSIFAQVPLDQKLAGVGLGNRRELTVGGEIKGHNDWLELLTQTGLVGLLLFAALQIAIFVRIRTMQTSERGMFLALFAAVLVMMAVSNSYVWRIQVSQLYYIMLAFIDISFVRQRSDAPRVPEMSRAPLPVPIESQRRVGRPIRITPN